MKILLVVLVLSTALFGAVNTADNTHHISDARAINQDLIRWGAESDNFLVWISNSSGDMNYYVRWPYISYARNTEGAAAAFIYSVAAVADRSANVTWSSTYLCIGWDTKMCFLTTSDARYFNEYGLGMSESSRTQWLEQHVTYLDI